MANRKSEEYLTAEYVTVACFMGSDLDLRIQCTRMRFLYGWANKG